MKTPEIDSRTKEDILDQIKKRSESYTPEWRFDMENPDAGTALALIYADMYQDTIQKYNQLSQKNMLQFFIQAGTFRQSARPAHGYLQLGLVNREVEGVAVNRGTKFLAESPSDSGSNIVFENSNDIYITPAKIKHIFQILPEEDAIYQINSYPFSMFGKGGDNLQEHRMYLSHNDIFYTGSNSRIYISLPELDLLYKMADQSIAVFEYSTAAGYERFEKVEVENERMVLVKGEKQPQAGKIIEEAMEACWIRISLKDITKVKNSCFPQILVSSEEQGFYPDLIVSDRVEQEQREYMPFGEQMGIYEEFYLSSNEGFSKKGARIQIDFQLHFIKIPIETYGQVRNIDWKLIMKQSDFIPDSEYDIGIQEIIWEYFNGRDWRKLPESYQFSKIFTLQNSARVRNISMIFQCPSDWEAILVHSEHSRFLRARVMKMNNQFRLNGQYTPPVISDTKISYHYPAPFQPPEHIILKNNLNVQWFSGREQVIPFEKISDLKNTLYIGFDMPISLGPVKLLIQIKGIYDINPRQMAFEYYNGKRWTPLNVIDGTEGFIREGIISILGHSDFSAIEMWGQKLYWIRIFAGGSQWPTISDIQMNVAEILAVDTKEVEYFNIKINKKNTRFQLSSGNIYAAAVWIRERQALSELDILQLKMKYKMEFQEAESGVGKQTWVCWKEVESFASSAPMDRHYRIEKRTGLITFSDGINGKIPDSGTDYSIMVRYQCGGGAEGNLPVGAVNKLHSTIGYINYVSNPDITTGGVDQEKLGEAIQRTARSFRSRGRAVTLKDYEELVLESSRDILMAKSYSGCKHNGMEATGNLAVVIVVANDFQNRRFFPKIKKQVISYLKGKVPECLFYGNRLHIVEPDFIQLVVRVKIYVKEMNEVFQIRNGVLKRLNQFMDLVNGNFLNQGWEIGQLPNQIQISNAITSVPGVIWIEDLRISAYIEQEGKREEVDFTEAGQKKFAIPVNGDHNIEIFIGGV